MIVKFDNAYSWMEMDQVPDGPGVYAWYSKLKISNADVDAVVRVVEAAKVMGEPKAREAVADALDTFIFNPFQETPYQVDLKGPLKPRYTGDINHQPSRSEALVARICQQPERFRKIAGILEDIAPAFTSPLYIGMASSLRTRIKTHKNRILELRESGWSPSTEEIPGAGFANQVVARKFEPTNLFVMVTEVQVETSEHNDIENLLNRINFPIFGRN